MEGPRPPRPRLPEGNGPRRSPSGAPAMMGTEPGKDVTEWYRNRYAGVITAERQGDQVLLLVEEGRGYGIIRQVLAFPGTEREVLLRCSVDHVPRSRIDPTRPLFQQWGR